VSGGAAATTRRFPFDCVLMAFNAADTWPLPFKKTLQPLAIEKEMGIIGVDTIAQLEENVRIARDFLPLNAAQLEALEQKVKPVYGQAPWYKRDAPANPPK